ncbi:potassium channel family protein [Streptomyces griseochromogenes]|uniref:potassium channel family protein n=1 Tax=Streptomyces griseochromogenes TaxID=68214 RepID=UPI00378F1C3C
MREPVTARPEQPGGGRGDRPRLPVPRPGMWATVQAAVRPLLITAGLITAYYLLPLDSRGAGAASVILALGLLGVGLVFAWEIRAIMRSPYPRLRAVEALVATLALFLMLFSCAYYILDSTTTGSFNEPLTRTDALYFTLSTFSTVGYGDIVARSQAARLVTMIQMSCGLLLAGIALRVLTGAVTAGLLRKHSAEPGRTAGTDDGASDGSESSDDSGGPGRDVEP